MHCKKCNAENEKGAKFCTKCGAALTEESKEVTEESTNVTSVTPNSTNDAGGIRKEMKKDAKSRVNGHLIGATAIYLVVCVVIGSIFKTTTTTYTGTGANIAISTTSAIPSIITALLTTIFTFGLALVAFKSIKGEKFEFSEVFLKPFENMKFLGYILLLTVIVIAISAVLVIIPIVGWIALIVAYIYYTPAFSTFMILLADSKTNKDITFVDTFKKSLELVKGNRVEYYGVTFSFIGWYLLAMLTCGILFIWLLPYMGITYVNLYQKWIKEKGFETTETGLSNGAIVGLTAGGCGCGCVVIILFFAAIIGIVATTIGDHINDPQIKSFIDKYSNNNGPIDENVLEDDINSIIDSYTSEYNS